MQDQDQKTVSRRQALQLGVGIAGIFATTKVAQATEVERCIETPPQIEGPFYPVDHRLEKDEDLTWVKGHVERAQGQVVYVQGKVQDDFCTPVSKATVEIWQACKSGRYNHKADPNPAWLDPHFQYFGSSITNEKGEYQFKTIIPGAYPAGEGWMRPPHIHFKVYKLGYLELITQLYFDSFTELNKKDLILQALPKEEQKQVMVSLQTPGTGFDPKSKIGRFDITLKRVPGHK